MDNFTAKFTIPKAFGTFDEPYMKDDLGRVLQQIISLDRDLEEMKQMMSLKTDFNIPDAYRLFVCNGEEKEGLTLR